MIAIYSVGVHVHGFAYVRLFDNGHVLIIFIELNTISTAIRITFLFTFFIRNKRIAYDFGFVWNPAKEKNTGPKIEYSRKCLFRMDSPGYSEENMHLKLPQAHAIFSVEYVQASLFVHSHLLDLKFR